MNSDAASEAFQPRAGYVLSGRYALDAPIGEGGTALVWRATHVKLGHPVAVKFLRNPQDTKLRERFLREAQIAAAIRHRNVVEVLDVDEEGDHVFMVMELLEGASLSEHLWQGALPVAEAVRLTAGILAGLAAVHDAGIVHRDVKPDNVLLVEDLDGHYPKIVDFGISHVSRMAGGGLRESGAHLRSVVPTQENLVIGTPEYMSPEQVRARAQIDAPSDVWSVGVMLYEMLAAELPFRGQTAADLFIAVATDPAPALELVRPDVPAAIASFVARALQKSPDDRFPNARAMRRALAQAVGEAAHQLEARGDAAGATALRGSLGAHVEPGDSLVFAIPKVHQSDAETRSFDELDSSEASSSESETREFDDDSSRLDGALPTTRRTTRVALVATLVAAAALLAWVALRGFDEGPGVDAAELFAGEAPLPRSGGDSPQSLALTRELSTSPTSADVDPRGSSPADLSAHGSAPDVSAATVASAMAELQPAAAVPTAIAPVGDPHTPSAARRRPSATPQPRQVRVSVEGLPAAGELWVDGRAHAGTTLALEPGRRVRIETRVNGQVTWSVEQAFSDDTVLRVEPRRRAARATPGATPRAASSPVFRDPGF